MKRVRLLHVTEFEYDGPVSRELQRGAPAPIDDELQSCVGFRLSTHPGCRRPTASRDYFGNWVHRFNVLARHRRLRVEAESVVMMQEPPSHATESDTLAALDDQRTALLDVHCDFLMPVASTCPPLAELAPLVRRRRGRQRRHDGGIRPRRRRARPRHISATSRARPTSTRRSTTCSPPAPASARTSPTC